MHPTSSSVPRVAVSLIVAALAVSVGLPMLGSPPASAAPQEPALTIVPTPKSVTSEGHPVYLKHRLTLAVDENTDAPAKKLLRETLESYNIRVDEAAWSSNPKGMVIRLGSLDRSDIDSELGSAKVTADEGYALTVGPRSIAIGGTDGAGQYYGVRTLAQLISAQGRAVTAAQVDVSDFPDMPLRGTIEGFYGQPWSQAERLDQLSFYGTVKMNTYIYAPKDDPYHRGRWREPYPDAKVAELKEFVQRGADNHVRFTFALSPGESICFSSAEDRAKLTAKFQKMYDIGVRSFSIPLDDIDYSTWHCETDRDTYGSPNSGNAGKAQGDLLNYVQQNFIETHPDTNALQMVPTEYSDTSKSSYKNALQADLDPAIVVMWTGLGVVPESITNADAAKAADAWGRKVFVWDNYPVNDFGDTLGRLLMAPYDKREAGLSKSLLGLVSNPMNQSAASKIAITGMADFSWNDTGYDPQRTWKWAFQQLTDDAATVDALLVFGDLNHLAPTFGGVWQQQAPRLRGLADAVAADLDSADLAAVHNYATTMVAGPDLINTHVNDPIFLSDASDWLVALGKWGNALDTALNALEAHRAGDDDTATTLSDRAGDLVAEAEAVKVTNTKNSWSENGPAPVKLGDGVVDKLIATIRSEINPSLKNWAKGSSDVQASGVELNLPQFVATNVADGDRATRWSSNYNDNAWVQVKLTDTVKPTEVTVRWEAACALAYTVQTSLDGTTWTDYPVDDPACGVQTTTIDGDEAVNYVRIQGVERKLSSYGYSIWEIEVNGTPA